MASLICGSLAFDTIMNFEGRFSQQILPDQLHILNVSFLVPTLRRDFGGCAGNIAYALKVLGGEPIPVAAVGNDGAHYVARMQDMGINTAYIRQVDSTYTAQAMIMTDQDNNQITAFHPGAMAHAHDIAVPALDAVRVGIISPDGREAMLAHAQQMHAAQIPFVFDPGQGLPMFDGVALRHFIDLASWVTVNDYEGQMLCERTGWSPAEISRQVQGLIITRAAQGSEVWVDGHAMDVPPTQAQAVVDPTGCGDAYRGALLFGLERGWPLSQCAALGNQLGAIKIAHRGPQNYSLDLAALGL